MSNKTRIWFNGELRESEECMVHVASHALHYGSSVFEGIRAYETPDGTFIFRGMDHLNRLNYSAAVYRMPMPTALKNFMRPAVKPFVTAASPAPTSAPWFPGETVAWV